MGKSKQSLGKRHFYGLFEAAVVVTKTKKINPELNLLISFHDYCSQTENVIKTHTVLVHLPQNEH